MSVVGAGQMGTGIGIVGSRTAGLNINFIDTSDARLRDSKNFISNWCSKEMAKERMTQSDMDAMMSRIKFFTDKEGLKDADFAVEAASEDFNIKK